MVLRLFHKTGHKRVANIRPKLSRRLNHALGSKVTASLDIKKPCVFAVEIAAKTALGLFRFSLNSLEFLGDFIVMIVLFLSKYEVHCVVVPANCNCHVKSAYSVDSTVTS